MNPGPRKTVYFWIEGLNSFAVSLYFFYLYFFLREEFGFGNVANLCVAALGGIIYALASWQAGRLAERIGYARTLQAGLLILIGALASGLFVPSAGGQIVVMVVATLGMCMTWPALEAVICAGENRARLQWMVGCYNLVWAGAAAAGFFSGGAILAYVGPSGIFLVPLTVFTVELVLALVAQRLPCTSVAMDGPASEPELHPHPRQVVGRFVRMSWVANPFAYIAINTIIAVTPGLTAKLGLTTAWAGIFFSLWFFVRFGAFWVLWKWDAWHYRFRWLLAAFGAMIVSFLLIVLAPGLAVVLLAQIGFGIGIGLVYYSSLFYSMDATEEKGAHGGIHEAAIGLGNFAGPAAGALSLHYFPHSPQSGAVAVTLLLTSGLAAMLAVWRGRGRG